MLVDGMKNESLSLLTIGSPASRDLALWDVEHSRLKFSLRIDHSVNFAIVSSTHKAVFCGGADTGVILTVSLTSGSLQQTFVAEEYSGMMDLTIAVDLIFVATPASGVVVISVTQNVVTGHLRDPKSSLVPTKLLVSSRNDTQLIVGYKHGHIHIFDVNTEAVIRSLSGHSGQINSLHLLPSGQLISSGDDQRGIIWNHELCGSQESGNDPPGMSEMWTKSKLKVSETSEVFFGDPSESLVNYRANCYTVDSTQHLLYAGFSCGIIQVFSLETGEFLCDSEKGS